MSGKKQARPFPPIFATGPEQAALAHYNNNKVHILSPAAKPKRQRSRGEENFEDKAAIKYAMFNHSSCPFRRSKLMFVGQGRAGKTSTIRSLLGEDFNHTEKSTEGFEVQRIDTGTSWKKDSGSYVVEHLIDAVKYRKNGALPGKSKTDTDLATKIPSSSEMARLEREFLERKNSKSSITFSIWDFGGQSVFYTLHHLFMTEYGCYVLVFNILNMINSSKRLETIEYLKFWLYSKKIHAGSAPILLLGTHIAQVNQESVSEVNEIIQNLVLKDEDFNLVKSSEEMYFFTIDNEKGVGIDELKQAIEVAVKDQDYIKESVPISYLRSLEHLFHYSGSLKSKSVLSLKDTTRILNQCGLNGEHINICLDFLHQRGLLLAFTRVTSLKNLIILHPQWMIDALTDIFYDPQFHSKPSFNIEFKKKFHLFEERRILSLDLLKNIWEKRGIIDEVFTFLVTLMGKSYLVVPLLHKSNQSLLVPSLVSLEINSNEAETGEEFSGPHFQLDFSGEYEDELEDAEYDNYVKYLPLGLYERLVCLCVLHSQAYKQTRNPDIQHNYCELSFGTDIDFALRVLQNESGWPIGISVECESDASVKDVQKLAQKIFEMVQDLKSSFFSSVSGSTSLAISLLLPSSKESGQKFIEYSKLMSLSKELSPNDRIRPRANFREKLKLKDFDYWLESRSDNWLNPDEDFNRAFVKDRSLKGVTSPTTKRLRQGLKYHCFLSYKQKSAIDLVGKQYYILTQRGFKCWYDQQFPDAINLESMESGVRDSMCYILFLSKDVFPSPYIEAEVAMALKLEKPIILLHHPNTDKQGYWSFGDYINSAPDNVKSLFSKIESIGLERRSYLEKAVNKRIEDMLDSLIEKEIEKLI